MRNYDELRLRRPVPMEAESMGLLMTTRTPALSPAERLRKARGTALVLAGLGLCVGACSASEDSLSSGVSARSEEGSFGASSDMSTGGTGSSFGSGSGGAGEVSLPPEVELSAEFELPKAGQRYVYAASPEHDSVAVIDAETLAIHTVEARPRPTCKPSPALTRPSCSTSAPTTRRSFAPPTESPRPWSWTS